MTASRHLVGRIAAEVVEQAPPPVNVSDLDAVTRRAVGRAAQAAGLSEAEFWAKTRAAASTSVADEAEARRIALAVRRG